VLSTLGAPERRRLKGRKGTTLKEASPAAVPTNRATVVRPEPFATSEQAVNWLAGIRAEDSQRDVELAYALGAINRALHLYRVSHGDPNARDVRVEHALAVRIGFGDGDDVVTGRYGEAWELPPAAVPRVRRSMEAPEERFAALLGARQPVLACEELLLRARMDLEAGRSREAALQARVALEALLSELTEIPGDRRGALEADRSAVGDAANAALRGELSQSLENALEASVERMESALRATRLSAS
jgi:hypothetical protein